MVADKKIAWPAQMSISTDGQGTSPEHVREIMTQSMESLIHHLLVTEGFRVPAGQSYTLIEHAKGTWGCHPFPTVAPARSEHTSRTRFRNLAGPVDDGRGRSLPTPSCALPPLTPLWEVLIADGTEFRA